MTGPWSAMDPLSAGISSSDSDSESDSGSESQEESKTESKKPNEILKKNSLDFESIAKHGYSGGPSVLYVPPPKAGEGNQDWSWSNGKRKGQDDAEKETIDQREETRKTANDGAVQAAAQAIAEHNYAKKQRREAAAEARALSFAQKEKRKREFGQTSRGKNYVEEEKRILRDQGVYSGFDV